MRKHAAAGAVAIAAALAAVPAGAVVTPGKVQGSCDSRTPRFHVGEAKDTLDRIYDHEKWRKENLGTPAAEDRWRRHRRCLEFKTRRRAVTEYKQRKEDSRDRWRKRRQEAHESSGSWCSPDPHPSGSGCWEIPTGCVMAESGGSWSAANPSGAVGPYQLLGHGAPFPVTGREEAMIHHRIAESLYRSSGLAPWVAPGC